MSLTRLTYDVWVPQDGRELTADTPPDHRVIVTTGDQMRAELEAGRLKLPPMRQAPVNSTCLWVWAALARQGATELTAAAFMADPPEFEPVKGADGMPEAVDVDPTLAGPGVSASD